MDFTWLNGWSIFFIAIATLVFAVVAMGLFSSSNHMPVEGKTVLITGASDGMGLCAAKQLAAKGANIIAVARSVGKLENALAEIKVAAKNPSNQRFHYISADVSVPSYAGPLLAEARAWNHGRAPDIVWCIAGTSTPGLFVEQDMAVLRRQMDVNYWGTAEISQAVLRDWLAPDAPVEDQPKHLVMTSSVLSFYTVPGYSCYAPTKFAMRGLADTLSQEALLYPQKVKVSVIFPGTILTKGYESEQATKPEITHLIEARDPHQTPEVVAEKAIRGLENGDYYIAVDWLGKLMRLGALGGMFRNNWIIDTLGIWLVSIVWMFVHPDIMSQIKDYAKKNGHPSTFKKA